MASVYAISAVTQTILGILQDAVPEDFRGVQFEPLQFADFQRTRPLEEGISLLLYRVAVSPLQRNLQPRADPNGIPVRPPLPVDLHYVMTAWGRTATRQQRLFGWAVRTLEDLGRLQPTLLNHYGGPETVFRDDETVDVIYEPLSMGDLNNLWDLFKPNTQLSIGYIARMVYLESKIEKVVGAPVQARVFDLAREEEGA